MIHQRCVQPEPQPMSDWKFEFGGVSAHNKVHAAMMFIHSQPSHVRGMRRCWNELIYLMKQEQRHFQQEDLLCILLYWESYLLHYLHQRRSHTTDTYWALNYSSFFAPVHSWVSLCIFFVQVYTTVIISQLFLTACNKALICKTSELFNEVSKRTVFFPCLFWIVRTPTSAITVNKRGKKMQPTAF